MIRILRRNLKRLIVVFLLGLILDPGAFGNELGLKTKYREIGRLHSDSDSIGSKIGIWQDEIFLNSRDNGPFLFQYTANREKWTLTHPDGTQYFSADLQRHIPKLVYQADSYTINAALMLADVSAHDKLYTQIESDDQNSFVLPSLVGQYRMNDWEFQLGGWQETDFQPFNYYRYTLYLLETIFVNARYQFKEEQSIKADYRIIDRVYPDDYDLKKNEIQVAYQVLNLLKTDSGLHWREMLLELIQTRYPDLDANKVDLTNYFRFKLGGLNHFLTHRLRYTDMITTYREGVYQYTLIETDEKKSDLWQQIEYAGFWRIAGSHFFLSWKYRIEDSLVENVILDQEAELKLVYAF